MTDPLVEIENLKTHFFTDEGVAKAVDDVSLVIPRGKTLGLVGESGCGKSVTALSVMRLVSPPGKIVGGRVVLHRDGRALALTELAEPEMRKIRGSQISMIFQEPMASLNPVFTIGSQIIEAIRLHQKVDKPQARRLAIEMLDKVRIPVPEKRIDEYPHQFSGGMRQRAMIAMALSCNPRLLIADEPTTALDVTIQAQILDLLRSLQADVGMSILIITHDLGIIAETADDVAVMYASKVVEYAPVKELFASPLHPYTHGLFKSRPALGQPKNQKLNTIPGMVPSPLDFPRGCKFHPRCPFRKPICEKEEPELREIHRGGGVWSPHIPPTAGHLARCHFAGELKYE
ncbi:MAG: peptide ABC transporter ATP-binding protein [Planctomycetes bacterium RBG_16_64_12]|nr:MAG: peptide ABC transporter ATP-binding protein [Planctomycetes bacterium RBG_16_64_12]